LANLRKYREGLPFLADMREHLDSTPKRFGD